MAQFGFAGLIQAEPGARSCCARQQGEFAKEPILPTALTVHSTPPCPHILRPMAVAAWNARAAGPTAALSGANHDSWSHCGAVKDEGTAMQTKPMRRQLDCQNPAGVCGRHCPAASTDGHRRSKASTQLRWQQRTCSTARSSSASFSALMPPNTTCTRGQAGGGSWERPSAIKPREGRRRWHGGAPRHPVPTSKLSSWALMAGPAHLNRCLKVAGPLSTHQKLLAPALARVDGDGGVAAARGRRVEAAGLHPPGPHGVQAHLSGA